MKRLIITALSVILLTSCVDKNFSLGDVTTDDAVIGQGDIVVPFGTISELKLNEFIDIDDIEEITLDAAGNYQFKISDKLTVEPVAPFVIEDFRVPLDVVIPSGTVPTLLGQTTPLPTIPLGKLDTDINFEIPAEVVSLDSVLMDTSDPSYSKMIMTLYLSGFTTRNVDAYIDVTFKIPKDFVFESEDVVATTVGDSTQYCVSIPANEVFGAIKSIELTTKKIGSTAVTPSMSIEYALRINSAALLSSSSLTTQKVGCQLAFVNSTPSVVYGEFNYIEKIENTYINISDITNLFGEEAQLKFYNPIIDIDVDNYLGFDNQLNLDMSSLKGSTYIDRKNIALNIPQTDTPFESKFAEYSLSRINEGSSNGNWVEFDLNDLLVGNPDNIVINGTMSSVASASGSNMFVTSIPKLEAAYNITIPLAAEDGFAISVTEELKDVFTEDVADLLFKNGKLTLFGTVTNSLPLDLEMSLTVTDQNKQLIDVDMGVSSIAGSATGEGVVSDFEFIVSEEDMPKMTTAKNINIVLNATSSDLLQGVALSNTQSIGMTIKAKKSGGISIN